MSSGDTSVRSMRNANNYVIYTAQKHAVRTSLYSSLVTSIQRHLQQHLIIFDSFLFRHQDLNAECYSKDGALMKTCEEL